MAKYYLFVTETVMRQYDIEADSKEEAYDMWGTSKVEPTVDDILDYADLEILTEEEVNRQYKMQYELRAVK